MTNIPTVGRMVRTGSVVLLNKRILPLAVILRTALVTTLVDVASNALCANSTRYCTQKIKVPKLSK